MLCCYWGTGISLFHLCRRYIISEVKDINIFTYDLLQRRPRMIEWE